MKMRRLSETDLARFCTLVGTPRLDPALDAYEAGGGSWSYNPVRASTLDAVNAQTPLEISIDRPKWEQIERQMTRACKGGEIQVSSNVELGRIIYEKSISDNWVARAVDFSSMPIGFLETVRFWSNPSYSRRA
jgi:hypothetical protein